MSGQNVSNSVGTLSSLVAPPPLPYARKGETAESREHLDYPSIRYLREEHFYRKLSQEIEAARKAHSHLEEKIEEEEEKFFHFLSQAVDIDDVGSLPRIIKSVSHNLGTEMPIHVFLTSFPDPTAMCIPRFSISNESEVDELIVVVSQHFMNNLDDDERAFILGHELAHALLGHSTVPTAAILDSELDHSRIPELRGDILRWSVCCEISCDLMGLAATNNNTVACQKALLKITTGLNEATFGRLGSSDVVSKVLNQYDRLADSVVKSVISTHPLTALRVKILEEVKALEFFDKFGTEMSGAEISRLRSDLNTKVDPLVRGIYPEIFDISEIEQDYISFHLGVATSLADGHMDSDEIEMISCLTKPGIDTSYFFNGLEEALQNRSQDSVIDELVERSISEAIDRNFDKSDASYVVKEILVIAAVDGRVDSNELKVIYKFAKRFGFTKNEIVYLANQINYTP